MSIFQPKKKTVEPDAVPTNVEQAIPIQGVYEDGIFLVGRNLWSKTFTFTDINYAVASREDKEGMFLGYSEILNSLDSGATTKITINNRRIQKSKFEERNINCLTDKPKNIVSLYSFISLFILISIGSPYRASVSLGFLFFP